MGSSSIGSRSAAIGIRRSHEGGYRRTLPMLKPLPVVYIAGPVRGASGWQMEQHARVAEALALEVWKLGAVALCPHTMTRFYGGEAPEALWLAGMLELVTR